MLSLTKPDHSNSDASTPAVTSAQAIEVTNAQSTRGTTTTTIITTTTTDISDGTVILAETSEDTETETTQAATSESTQVSVSDTKTETTESPHQANAETILTTSTPATSVTGSLITVIGETTIYFCRLHLCTCVDQKE